MRWIGSEATFAERLVAFAAVEVRLLCAIVRVLEPLRSDSDHVRTTSFIDSSISTGMLMSLVMLLCNLVVLV